MEYKKTENVVVTNIDADKGIVEAIWAVMGNIDEGKDILHLGAFKKTFSERGNQIKLLDNHRTESVMDALGTVLELKELLRSELPQELKDKFPDATGGAWGKFQFLIDTPEGEGAFKRIKSGATKGWSFSYDAINPDRTSIDKDDQKISVRNLREVKLYEISPVLFAMNEATITTDAKGEDKEKGTREKEQDKEDEKLVFENKAIDLSDRVQNVRDSFYTQYPDIDDVDRRFGVFYWVKQIWDEFVIVRQRGSSGKRLWKINYTIGDQNTIVFDTPQDWVEVTMVAVPLNTTEPSKSEKTPTPEGAEPSEEKDTHLLQLIDIELEEMEVI